MTIKQQTILFGLICVVAMLSVFCGRAEPAVINPTPVPFGIIAEEPAATTIPTDVPPLSPTPIPTQPPAPSSQPTQLPAPTLPPVQPPAPTQPPAPSPTPSHPLTIDAMRQQAYPGSDITFIEHLEPGTNYDQYIVSYESEGHTIFALMTIPQGDMPRTGWPVIVFNHGYIAPDRYRTAERYVYYVEALAQAGYIVFNSDYRGHGDSEGRAIIAYRDPGYTTDVLNAVSTMKGYELSDPDRIGMWGHSMGGFITLRAMVMGNDDIKAGVIWGGVVTSYLDTYRLWWFPRWEEVQAENPGRASQWTRWLNEFGDIEENPEFWASISANSYLADLSGPLQLHHSTTDGVVPVALSEVLQDEVTAAGLSSELFLYEGDDHDIDANFQTAMARTVAFFDEHVKGGGGE